MGQRGRPAADSPPAQRGAKPLRRGWCTRGSGRRGPGTHSHGIAQLCTRLCAHTRARGHTRPARRGLVPGRGPAGRAVPPWAGQGRREGLGKPAPQPWGLHLCQPSAPPRPASPGSLAPQPRREARNGPRGGPAACGPRPRLSRDSPGQRLSPAAGPSARWSLQQGEKTLTRCFKPISRRASGEPQRAPDNPICCE